MLSALVMPLIVKAPSPSVGQLAPFFSPKGANLVDMLESHVLHLDMRTCFVASSPNGKKRHLCPHVSLIVTQSRCRAWRVVLLEDVCNESRSHDRLLLQAVQRDASYQCRAM